MSSAAVLQQIWHGFLDSMWAGLATGIGAMLIFLKSTWTDSSRRILLAIAAGMMLSASIFSLLVPAYTQFAQFSNASGAWVLLFLGTAIGVQCLSGIHTYTAKHLHKTHLPSFLQSNQRSNTQSNKQANTQSNKQANTQPTQSLWLMVLAIVIHNFPEGMSVGIASVEHISAHISTSISTPISNAGNPVLWSIALQNIPEGLAVAAALLQMGISRNSAFLIALLTGCAEALGGILGATLSFSHVLLPWGLSFAAGAMLFAVIAEVLPEAIQGQPQKQILWSVVSGALGMIVLDAYFA